MTAAAYYLYCIAPAAAGRRIAEPGVLEWRSGELLALVREVPREDYCGAAAEARLQDLAWVGPRACGHAAVVEQVTGPVLPARFATLFSSLQRLDEYVCRHHDAITAFFAALGDNREWGVKVFWDAARARQALPAGQAAPRASSAGTRYLQQKRLEAEAGRQLRGWWSQICADAAAGLSRLAADFRERAPDAEACRNWAFLVAPASEATFRARVEALNTRHPGLAFRLSGPWPPYSFAPEL